jgi:hypothetical protein
MSMPYQQLSSAIDKVPHSQFPPSFQLKCNTTLKWY